MPDTRNLCAQIPTALHAQVCEAREQSGLTTVQYITNLLIGYYEMKENGGKQSLKQRNSRKGPKKGTTTAPPEADVLCFIELKFS